MQQGTGHIQQAGTLQPPENQGILARSSSGSYHVAPVMNELEPRKY